MKGRESEIAEVTISTVTVEEAEGHLKEIIAGMKPGEEVVLVVDGEEVATLARTGGKEWPAKAGSYRKEGFWMAPDFDEPLEDFKDYMG